MALDETSNKHIAHLNIHRHAILFSEKAVLEAMLSCFTISLKKIHNLTCGS